MEAYQLIGSVFMSLAIFLLVTIDFINEIIFYLRIKIQFQINHQLLLKLASMETERK